MSTKFGVCNHLPTLFYTLGTIQGLVLEKVETINDQELSINFFSLPTLNIKLCQNQTILDIKNSKIVVSEGVFLNSNLKLNDLVLGQVFVGDTKNITLNPKLNQLIQNNSSSIWYGSVKLETTSLTNIEIMKAQLQNHLASVDSSSEEIFDASSSLICVANSGGSKAWQKAFSLSFKTLFNLKF